MTLPASSVISAVRRSHSIWSNGLTLGSLKTRSTRADFFAAPPLALDLAARRHRCGTTAAFMRRRNQHLLACVYHEIFLSRRSKFYFVTNHPTALTQKTGRENQLLSPLFGFSPTAQFQAKPHLVGNSGSLYPTYCGDKKNIEKSYRKVTTIIYSFSICLAESDELVSSFQSQLQFW